MREFCKTQRFVSLNPGWSLCEGVKQDSGPPKRKPRRHLIEVHPDVYAAMFEKLQFEDETLKNYQDGPHGDKANILSRYVTQETLVRCSKTLYISKSKQNRMVAYDKGGRSHYGMVTHIYGLPDFGGRILVGIKKMTHLNLQVVQVVNDYELLDPSEVQAV
ncbi:hypothetical protein VP01_2882g3 [Puccinia sorghi]|nr:hypothetical protein VP01_2882g3 [Puccinia sorghi]